VAIDINNRDPKDPNGIYSLDTTRASDAWVKDDDWSQIYIDAASAKKAGATNKIRVATAITNDGRKFDVIVGADGQPISAVGDSTGYDDDRKAVWARENPVTRPSTASTKPAIPPGGSSVTEGTPLPDGSWDNNRPREVIRDKNGQVIWSEELTGAALTAWRNNQQAGQPQTGESRVPVEGRPGWTKITRKRVEGANTTETVAFVGPDGVEVPTLPNQAQTGELVKDVPNRPGWRSITRKKVEGGNTTEVTVYVGPDGVEVPTLPSETKSDRKPVEGQPGVYLVSTTKDGKSETHFENEAGQTIQAPPNLPASIVSGGITYIKQPDNTYAPAQGIPTPGAGLKNVDPFEPDYTQPDLGFSKWAAKQRGKIGLPASQGGITQTEYDSAVKQAHDQASVTITNITAQQNQQRQRWLDETNQSNVLSNQGAADYGAAESAYLPSLLRYGDPNNPQGAIDTLRFGARERENERRNRMSTLSAPPPLHPMFGWTGQPTAGQQGTGFTPTGPTAPTTPPPSDPATAEAVRQAALAAQSGQVTPTTPMTPEHAAANPVFRPQQPVEPAGIPNVPVNPLPGQQGHDPTKPVGLMPGQGGVMPNGAPPPYAHPQSPMMTPPQQSNLDPATLVGQPQTMAIGNTPWDKGPRPDDVVIYQAPGVDGASHSVRAVRRSEWEQMRAANPDHPWDYYKIEEIPDADLVYDENDQFLLPKTAISRNEDIQGNRSRVSPSVARPPGTERTRGPDFLPVLPRIIDPRDRNETDPASPYLAPPTDIGDPDTWNERNWPRGPRPYGGNKVPYSSPTGGNVQFSPGPQNPVMAWAGPMLGGDQPQQAPAMGAQMGQWTPPQPPQQYDPYPMAGRLLKMGAPQDVITQAMQELGWA
jgi:hypothetical protein